ncbi:MAG: hypothetical protein ACREE0_18965 [Phenylobacterium sp.]
MIVLAFIAAAAIAAEPCRTVHGRMELWNGAPSVRIWVVGTDRVLGVVQPHDSLDDLPASVRRIWSGKDVEADWATAIYGDFKVCPVGGDRPGRMQRVMLIEAVHLTGRPRP